MDCSSTERYLINREWSELNCWLSELKNYSYERAGRFRRRANNPLANRHTDYWPFPFEKTECGGCVNVALF